MIIHDIRQGSQDWHKLRSTHFTASEASAMLGVSKYTSRQDLLRQKATGCSEEISASQQGLFNKGHAAEASARPIAEGIVGEDLFPATVTAEIDGLPLLASCDGMTMLGDTLFEHKLFNADVAACILAGDPLHEHYTAQMEQQLMVTGAEKCLFMCSDGTEDRCARVWYESNPELRQRIIAGWKQFAEDLANYQHVGQSAPIAAEPVKDLPAVSVKVSGSIDVVDNFKVFETALRDFIDNRLIREPQTDQDFADLDAQIKALKKAESALDAAEEQLLSQVSTIDEIKRTKDMLRNLARDNRLLAEKLLKQEKDKRRAEILQRGKEAMHEHLRKLNETLGGKVRVPEIAADFAGAMKGKKTIASLNDAVDTELAQAKIEANKVADKIRLNLETLRATAVGYEFLFSDAQQLVMKENDDLGNLIAARIAEHKLAEKEKEERIKRQAEEEARQKIEHEQRLEQTRKDAEERARQRDTEQAEADAKAVAEAEQRGREQAERNHFRAATKKEDIVHLLRIAAMNASSQEHAALMLAAADEIERLRDVAEEAA